MQDSKNSNVYTSSLSSEKGRSFPPQGGSREGQNILPGCVSGKKEGPGERVLLHCCCAPCSSAILEWMLANDIHPTLYYCNPNIFPEEEYLIRKNELNRYAQKLGLEVIDGDYDHETWREYVQGHEDEPERGSRCLLCFKLRMLRTAQVAQQRGIRFFATTLASSRWKSLEQIEEAGTWAAAQTAGTEFWARNWRKGGLQQRRNELLRQEGFYNQLYCGCEFSMRKES